MNTMKVEVFDHGHLSHSASGDEANDEKAVTEDVAWPGPICGVYGRSNLIGCIAAGCLWVVPYIYGCLVEESWRGLLERASGARIFDEQVFDGTPELQISAAHLLEKGVAVVRLTDTGKTRPVSQSEIHGGERKMCPPFETRGARILFVRWIRLVIRGPGSCE
jgi:hypothetical protein